MKIYDIVFLFIFCANITGRVSSDNSTDKNVNSALINKQIHLITSGFSSVFWNYIINSNFLNRVSYECSSHLNKLIESSLEGQPWAFKFLSLSGSKPNNFLDGNYAAFGSYDSCLDYSTSYNDKAGQPVKGQYCLTSFEPDSTRNGQILGQLYPHYFDSEYNFTIKVGFCVPSVCTQNDVHQIIIQAFNDYSWRLVDVHSCEVKTNFHERLLSASKGHQFLFWTLVGLVCIVILGTLTDLKDKSQEKSSLFWIKQFSAIKSVKSLFRETDSESRIPALDGIRLFAFWVVFNSHAFMWPIILNASFLVEDHEHIKTLPSKFYAQPIIDDWIVEGLFYLGGASSAVTLFNKVKPETPIIEYLKIIFLRAAFLIPILLPAIALEIILPIFGSGPIYQSINRHKSNICAQTFWKNLLHIQNNCSPIGICAAPTWSVAVEWQLFAFACILIYIYKRNYRLGLTLNVATILFGLYRVSTIFLNKNVMPTIIMTSKDYRDIIYRATHYYLPTESHVWSYFGGILFVVILAGNYEAKIKQMFPHDKIWVYSFCVILIYTKSLWNMFGMKIEPVTTVIYVCFNKFVTALWCVSTLLHHGKKFRRILAKSKSIDMYIHPEESESEPCISYKERAATADSESSEKTEIHNQNYLSKIRKLDPLEFIIRILRPAFFVHHVVYAWYFTSLRSSIPTNVFTYMIQVNSLIVFSVFFGLLYHILVMGPIERINYISTRKKVRAKSHSS